MPRTVILTTVLSLLCCLHGYAATYYVSMTGADAAAGSAVQPWRTLQHAANIVQAGDTVVVRAGTYAGFKAASSGAEGSPITFRAATGAAAALTASGPDNWHGSIIEIENVDWWVVDGFEVTGAGLAGVDVRVADHVTVRRCHAHHNFRWGIFTAFTDQLTLEFNECSHSEDEHGIYVSNSSDDVVVQYNTCHHNNGSGIQINADPAAGGDGISTNATVAHNVLYENGQGGGAAVNLASVRNSLIANNLIYANHASGIAGWDDGQGTQWGVRDNRIIHNTVHMPADGRWALSLKNGSTANTIRNNILLHDASHRGGLETDTSSLPGLDSDYNIIERVDVDENVYTLDQWQTLQSQDSQSQSHSPTETFPPSGGYMPAAGSPAVDAGILVPDVLEDIRGFSRPQGPAVDAGCYERAAGGGMAGLTLLLSASSAGEN